MEGGRNFRHSYTFFFLLIFVVLILFHPSPSIYASTLSSTESLTISSNRTIVSPGDVFELGFFRISSTPRWYLGIWYKNVSQITYAWVANRDNPLSTSTGTLKISDMNLVLLDDSGNSVWSTNHTRGNASLPVVGELFDNGNFVLRDFNSHNQDGVLWQSFDFPTDTLLPEMKLGYDLTTGHNRFLRSWRSSDDPSSGEYSFVLETESRGLPELFIWGKNGMVTIRCGPWDGKRFSGMPEMQKWHQFNISYNFTENNEEAAFSFRVFTPNAYWKLTITFQGFLQLSTWEPTTLGWDLSWQSYLDDCVEYGMCSPYSYCNMNMSPECKCFKGFGPRDSRACARKTQLSCSGDGFSKQSNMKLPDTEGAIVDRRIGLKECEERCRMDCNCTGYANTDIQDGGSGCVIWTSNLNDIQSYPDAGQDLYVKLASVDLEEAEKDNGKTRTTIGLTVGAIVLLLLSPIIIFFWRRKYMQARTITDYANRHQNLLRTSGRHLLGEDTEDIDLPLMEYEVVAMATNDFSECNKLGEGGFGTVYKGMLPEGEEIAVKRLSKVSTQGTDEFKTELMLIAKLQHNNLVRLLGCYADVEEKILVYEYLENLSLDYYLFDKIKSYELNWQKRFDIIKGIARGLLYLHQDSPCKVIHRDLKASNILLDKDMIPKISDFGMARIFGRKEDEATTRRIVGTYGYMSPEYAIDGLYSEKSDVFSFGVLILEIISGKQNRGFTSSNPDSNLLSYVWRHMEEGTWLAVVDPNIINLSSPSPTYRPDEILRCITIGLACVQEYAEDRPTMSWAVLMLGSTEAIRKPRPPAYCVGKYPCLPKSSSSWTEMECTILEVTAR